MSALAEALFFFDGSEVEAARAAQALDLQIIAFSEVAAGRLGGASIPFVRAVDALGDDPEMPLYRAAADWTKRFGSEAVDSGGQTLRDALVFRDTTLWWWAELYLHHNTEAARRVRFLETVARVVEAGGARAIKTHGLTADETRLVRRLCAAQAMDFEGGGERPDPSRPGLSALTAGLLEASKVVATAAKRTRGDDEPAVQRPIVFVSHAAFWKSRTAVDGTTESYEHYFDSLLGEARGRGLPVVTLGVGPQTTFRTRSSGQKWRERLSSHRDDRYIHINRFVTPGVAAAALKAFGRAMSTHHRFRSEPSLQTAFSHRRVSFADLSSEDLARTLLHQVPWAARTVLEFDAAFRELKPGLACLYAESSGLGRAAVTAAKALGIKTLGVQHGILYPNYFSYERTPDDVARGTPIPDLTALYGNDGVRLFENTFQYPPGRVVATGSPRYDSLAADLRRVDRDELRKALGVEARNHLIILASRYTGIRDTHKASGPAFPGLLRALRGIEDAILFVKPHPAEPKEAYDADIRSAGLGPRVRVISDRSLTELLPAAGLLVTVESLSATEALVAGVPVVVLRHPSNLRDLVASGAALGVREGEDPRSTMQSLLSDPDARAAWRRSRDAFLVDVAQGVDGEALNRLIKLVSDTAGVD